MSEKRGRGRPSLGEPMVKRTIKVEQSVMEAFDEIAAEDETGPTDTFRMLVATERQRRDRRARRAR